MTTIAYRDGVIAADTFLTTPRGDVLGEFRKISSRGRLLVGVAGDTAACQTFLRWFDRGAAGPPPPMKRITAIVVRQGHPLIYAHAGRWCELAAPFFAIGSGCEYAMGALAAGASAREAVEIASRFDTATGGSVMQLELPVDGRPIEA